MTRQADAQNGTIQRTTGASIEYRNRERRSAFSVTLLGGRSVFRSDWFIEHRVEAGAADAWTVADTALVLRETISRARIFPSNSAGSHILWPQRAM